MALYQRPTKIRKEMEIRANKFVTKTETPPLVPILLELETNYTNACNVDRRLGKHLMLTIITPINTMQNQDVREMPQRRQLRRVFSDDGKQV